MSRRFVLPVVGVGGEIRVRVYSACGIVRRRRTYQHSSRLHELGRHLTSILTIILAPILRCIRSVPSNPSFPASAPPRAHAQRDLGGGDSRRLR